jgi:hypothetical protein
MARWRLNGRTNVVDARRIRDCARSVELMGETPTDRAQIVVPDPSPAHVFEEL